MNLSKTIKVLQTYPTDMDAVPEAAETEHAFRTALKEAISFLKKSQEYRYHNLEKDPNDLPKEGHLVHLYGWNYHDVFGKYIRTENYTGFVRADAWSFSDKLSKVIAWRYVEPYERESEEKMAVTKAVEETKKKLEDAKKKSDQEAIMYYSLVLETLNGQTNNDLVGTSCYKMYVAYTRASGKSSHLHPDRISTLRYYIEQETLGRAKIVVKEGKMTKSDIKKLGKLVFLNRKDIEDALEQLREEVRNE